MAITQMNYTGEGGVTETDWMFMRLEAKVNSNDPKTIENTHVMICTKGYTKIRCKNNYAGSASRALAVLTANVRNDTLLQIDSSETVIGTMNSTTAVDIDITGNDYVWFAFNQAVAGDPLQVWYKLIP